MAKTQNQFLFKDKKTGVEIWMKRLDLTHPGYSGNKVYKLKYNLMEAKDLDHSTLLTFGGAFSNHIAATALTGKKQGFKTIGVIRGEELGQNLTKTLEGNPTLSSAKQNGMQLHFISREAYRQKNTGAFQEEMLGEFGRAYILPEGGTNALAIKGCEEILNEEDRCFDVLCCPVGTGGTMAGLINKSSPAQTVLGFSALNADLQETIRGCVHKRNWQVLPEKIFGGYAKINPALVRFINDFNHQYAVLLDPIYTGKMMYAVLEKLKNGHFNKNSRILAVHTGGLQGIRGMNKKLSRKGYPTINV